MNYILDVDTGIDDALAIIYACAQQTPLAITTCFGNVEVQKATNNTLALIEKLQLNIPVYEGSAHSFTGNSVDRYAKAVHGQDGLANQNLMTTKLPQQLDAVDYILESARKYGEEFVIIATGPLTNIALAIQKDKKVMQQIKELIIMGGAVTVEGNVTPYAEANILSDVEAADYVFNSGLPITLVGLDVTMQSILKKEQISHWSGNNNNLTFCYDIVDFYMQAYENFYPGIQGCALHDPLAVAAFFNKEWLKIEDFGIEVVQEGIRLGQTVQSTIRPAVGVCIHVDDETFIQHFITTLENYLDRNLKPEV